MEEGSTAWILPCSASGVNHDGAHRRAIRGRLKRLARSLERERGGRERLGVEQAGFDQPHETGNIAHRIRASEVPWLMTLRCVGPLIRRNRDDAAGRMAAARGDDMADG